MQKYYSIGGLKISLAYEPGNHEICLEKALDSFSSGPFETPDIHFQIDLTSPFPALGSYRKLFASTPNGLWTIYENSEKSHYLISLQNVGRDQNPYRIIRADRRFCNFMIFDSPTEDNLFFPLEFPLTHLAVSGYLNINKIGIVLHSACISIEGRGYLFAGVSGAGKSTISEIWQQDQDADVLTDERVLIRKMKGDLWAFGTPWHGTSEIYKNVGAPIKMIFFIKHGKENRATPISKTDAANRLMVRCFPTFWNREGMQFSVDFSRHITYEKECYELEFVNDSSVREYLKKFTPQKRGK